MHATIADTASARRGVRLVARLVMDARPGPAFVPEVRRAMVGEESKRSWTHLVYAGTWEGHRNGSFTFDADAFDAILRNFDAQANELPVDYEHGTEWAPPGMPVPAAGWIHSLTVEGDSLWAYVEWTERAAGFIAAGEYRFCSVVVDFEAVDRKSGEPMGARLVSLGLTNVPFVDGQEPIALSLRPRPATPSTSRGNLMSKTRKPARGAKSLSTRRRLALADGAKALLEQVASLLSITLEEGDDLYWKVMDALGALQQAAKVEEMLGAPTADAAAMSARKVTAAHVLAILAESEHPKITRDAIVDALNALEGDEFSAEQLMALVEALKAMAKAQAAGGDPEPVTEPPSPPPADDADASTKPRMAAAEVLPDDAAAVTDALAQATGLADAAALLAFVQTHQDALRALVDGGAQDGTQADAGGQAMSDRGVRAVLVQLSAATTRLKAAEDELVTLKAAEAKRAEAERVAAADRFVDELVTSGRILDVARGEFRELHLENPKRAVALAEKLTPAVPTGRVAGPDPKKPAGAPSGKPVALSDLDAEERAHFDALWGTGLYKDRAVCAAKARDVVTKSRASA